MKFKHYLFGFIRTLVVVTVITATIISVSSYTAKGDVPSPEPPVVVPGINTADEVMPEIEHKTNYDSNTKSDKDDTGSHKISTTLEEFQFGTTVSRTISEANSSRPSIATNLVVTNNDIVTADNPAPAEKPSSTGENPVTGVKSDAYATEYAYGFSLYVREIMAKTLYKESNCPYTGETEASKVIWSMLNRYDSGILWFGADMVEIITKEDQYDYDPDAPLTEENLALVNDVIERWCAEKSGSIDVGRTLPAEYYAFWGDGRTNYFYKWSSGGLGNPGDTRIVYPGGLPSPYAS